MIAHKIELKANNQQITYFKKACGVSRIADKWFISFGIKPSMSYLSCKNQASVGIDLGITTLAVLSNGSFVESPRPLKKLQKKLTRVSRQLSKKQHSRKKGYRISLNI